MDAYFRFRLIAEVVCLIVCAPLAVYNLVKIFRDFREREIQRKELTHE